MKVSHFIKESNIINDDTIVVLNITVDDIDSTFIIKGRWFEDQILAHFNDVIKSVSYFPADPRINLEERVIIFIDK